MTSLRFGFRVLLPSLIVLLFALTVQAQSGRRQNKPAPAAPVPTPTPEPTPAPKVETKTDLGFIVSVDQSSMFDYYPLSYYSAVVEACAGRLRKASSATVTTAGRLNRGEAIKKAKAEKTTYVILLRLVSYSMRGSGGQDQGQDIELEYTVFAPVTAKIATTGKSYQNASRKGPIIVQPPGGGTSSILYREMMLKRAAEDAADRILKSLHL
ncbi:MAG TPA: hypothetical protein VF074_00310 [Pyrinomonadaceae bacterium]